MGNEIMFKIGVFGIITDDQRRVLLCHRRDYDLWNLPGGGLKKDESPWEGVIREIKEETGLKVVVERISGVYAKPEQNEIVFSFLCRIANGHIAFGDEVDKIEYFEFEKIPQNTAPKQIERIKDALKNAECVMKIQKGHFRRKDIKKEI